MFFYDTKLMQQKNILRIKFCKNQIHDTFGEESNNWRKQLKNCYIDDDPEDLFGLWILTNKLLKILT